jgi:hypothetical protein
MTTSAQRDEAIRAINSGMRTATESMQRMGVAVEHLWNPWTDDGDAQRLAVKLGIEVCYGFNDDGSIQRVIIDDTLHVMVENNDPYAAARHAIVLAAAEQKRMP